MTRIEVIRQQYKNAVSVAAQFRRGEWSFSSDGYYAERNKVVLWVDGGSFNLDTFRPETNPFGLVFRHLAWYAGVRVARKKLIHRTVPDLSK